MEFPLRDIDILDISNIHRGTRIKKVADKLKWIKLLSQKRSYSSIAEVLEIDEKTVYNWKKEFLEVRSLQEFVAEPSGNYSGKLDDEKNFSVIGLITPWLGAVSRYGNISNRVLE